MFLARATSDARLIDLDLVRLIPVMICRMIISLKKAATVKRSHITVEVSSVSRINQEDTDQEDSVQLSVLKFDR